MKNISTYEVADYLVDNAFCDYVLHGKDQVEWQQLIQQNPEQQSNIDLAKKMIRNIRFQESTWSEGDKKALWTRIQDSITKEKGSASILPLRYMYWIASAACLALLVIYLSRPSPNVLTHDMAGLYELPSASSIELAESSSISYDIKKWGQERVVTLKGQANFDVTTTGQDFSVMSPHGTVRVLGTNFTIVDIANQYYVKVQEGVVEVTGSSYKDILTVGDVYLYNPMANKTYQDFISSTTDLAITYHFKDQELTDILALLENDLAIVVDDNPDLFKAYRFTGFVSNTDTVEKILNKILWPLNLKYQIDGQRVEIYK